MLILLIIDVKKGGRSRHWSIAKTNASHKD